MNITHQAVTSQIDEKTQKSAEFSELPPLKILKNKP